MTVTMLLLNWKRPENLTQILDRLATQTLKPTIFLWNNAQTPFSHPAVDWQIDSGRNAYCMPRWWMGQHAETDFVMTCDDDLIPADNRLLQDAVDLMAVQPPDTIIGPQGIVLDPDQPYERCGDADFDEPCDIILGRMMLLRSKLLRALPIPYGHPEWNTTDDIVVSGLAAAGRSRQHLRAAVFEQRLLELPAPYAVCTQPGHYQRREVARRRWLR